MDPWISHETWRRDPLKGHDSKKAVRAAIRYARSHSRNLRIFVRIEPAPGLLAYTELPASEWDATFAEEV
jgi:hypothetical protein